MIKQAVHQFWITCGISLCCLATTSLARAQIVSDGTLSTTVKTTDNLNFTITDGNRAGSNLFHSFGEFSVPTKGSAVFDNASDIQNIVSRVTGSSVSNIDGLLKANGTANLFLINPNGIIFERNASLDVGGSFVASTANSLRFADSTEFSATAPQTSPLLTVSVPIGLQFGSNPGEIINRSQASPNGAVNINVGLQVQSGRTLALVGGNIFLEGGNLTAPGGRIELGSAAGAGLVNLREIETGYTLTYEDVQNFQDIQFSQGTIADASGSGGGAIQLQGRNITLTDDSQVLSATLGAGTGEILAINAAESVKLSGGAFIASFTLSEGRAGDVLVRASDSVELVGTTADAQFPSGLGSQVFGDATGSGGDLTVETRRLLIQDGAIMDVSTFGAGRAGNVLVKALDSVELIGTSPNSQIASGIFAQVGKLETDNIVTGSAGNLTINTGRLAILDGAQVSTAARTGGSGGTLTINASDSIQLSGASPLATLTVGRSGIFVSAEPGAIGDAGALNVSTKELTVEKGAEISANNFGTGKGGTATFNIGQLIIRDGGEVRARSFGEGPGGTLTVNAAESLQVIGIESIGSNRVTSALSTQAQASGNAGDLNITTGSLNVQDGAEVTVSSTGSGLAGKLTVEAGSIGLDNKGALTAQTASGQGGNINLEVQDLLLLRRNSQISTQAGTEETGGTGGSITIDTDNLVALENSDIDANAFGGSGGQVEITTQGIFRSPDSDITATSNLGPQFSGTIEINTPDVDPSQGLAELPDAPVNVEVAQGCQAGSKQASVEFFNTGRGGLAPSPYEPLSSSEIWEDVSQGTKNLASTNRASATTPPNKIVEAQGWVMNEKGEAVLVAEMPATHSQRRCRLR